VSRHPLRVFVSHTSEFRKHPETGLSYIAAVEAAIAAQEWAIIDMAYFAARDQAPADYCIEKVRNADVFIGVIGLKYGSPVRDRPDVSHTELEYEIACEVGLPRLMFMLDETRDVQLPIDALHDSEYGIRQELFRQQLDRLTTTARFASPAELQLLVERALNDLNRRSIDDLERRFFTVPPQKGSVITRSVLTDEVVKAVCADRKPAEAPLTAVIGGGGFGKTTLAGEVCRDPRILKRFPAGVLWVTIGEHVTGPDLAAKVNGLSEQLSGSRPAFTDPDQAGQHLGNLLRAQRLIVIDDVWRASQLTPFLMGGEKCARLVTTRVLSILPDNAVAIPVGPMTMAEARNFITTDMPRETLDGTAVDELVATTGCWPVLIRLTNRAVCRRYIRYGLTPNQAVSRAYRELIARGPAALDVTISDERSAAVRATIEASLAMLGDRRTLFLEMAVFPANQSIPQVTLERLWKHTTSMTIADVERFCFDLVDLSLVEEYTLVPYPRMRLHEVLHDYIVHLAGETTISLHKALLDAHRSDAPWWEMPEDEPYLMDNLIFHLDGAKSPELDGLVSDLRWLSRRLEDAGPEALEGDLTFARVELARRLTDVIRQNAHLLGSLEPKPSLTATLLSRLSVYSEFTPAIEKIGAPPGPYLHTKWPLPDMSHPALIRVITAHTDSVRSVTISPDGTWLASASHDCTVRLWNVDGTPRGEPLVHTEPVRAVAISDDGTWLVSTGYAFAAKFWNSDGTERGGVSSRVTGNTVSISLDGTWLAVACEDGVVRLYGRDGNKRATAVGHGSTVHGVAISPDSTWFATVSQDGSVRFWSSDGIERAMQARHPDRMHGIAISPDGSWLATTSHNGNIRLWNTDGSEIITFSGHDGPVLALAISPDGQWLATTSSDHTVILWNRDGSKRTILTGHTGAIRGLSISPDGSWLATASQDGSVRLWNSKVSSLCEVDSHQSQTANAVAISPDGTWLASTSDDHAVRLWNADGTLRAAITRHTGAALAVAISPDAKWMVTSSTDNTLRLWNADGTERAVKFTGVQIGLGISPDGTWFVAKAMSGPLTLWKVDGSPPIQLKECTNQIMRMATVRRIAISPDGTWLAAIDNFKVVYFVNMKPAKSINSINVSELSKLAVTDVAISPDGSWFIIADDSQTAQIWNTDGTLRSTITDPAAGITGVAISPDGVLLATTNADQEFRIWDIYRNRCICALRVGGSVQLPCWGPDNRTLAAISEAGIYVLEIRGLPASIWRFDRT
jgi:WD40 repeat protein